MTSTPPLKPCFVGIDTSNYTTSVGVVTCDEAGVPQVVANIKYPLPVKAGERGLRQSDAVFAHIKNLPLAMADLQKVIHEGGLDIHAVGYSATPRDALDSYMPCFLAGKVAATSLATGGIAHHPVPLYAFSHQSGHIMAALYGSGALQVSGMLESPFLAFHVSGGTTEVVHVTPKSGGRVLDVALVGQGDDLHAGQVIDRIGVLMGLSFPCGKAMEELATQYLSQNPPIKGLKVSVSEGICHLSGLENMATDLWRKTSDPAYVSAFVLSFIAKTLRRMTEQVQSKLCDLALPVVYAGGVMSNHLIRPTLSQNTPWQTYFSDPAFAADNAAGTALLCALEHKES